MTPLEMERNCRCLMQNGVAPCSADIVDALERDSRKAANFARRLPKGGIENSWWEFTDHRRFSTDSSVQFVDRDKL